MFRVQKAGKTNIYVNGTEVHILKEREAESETPMLRKVPFLAIRPQLRT